MSRKIQPNQVVTYRQKIVFKEPENQSKNFFDTFLGLFLTNILAIVAGVATAGIASSFVGALGANQLIQAFASTTIESLVNFSISTTFDAINNRLTTENLLFNALFSITDIGKFGRALKEDKLIKLLNSTELLEQIGFNSQIKNFYELKNFLKLKDVILKDKTKIAFKKVVTDAELLQSIFLVADSTLKKELKSLSYDQLKNFLEIEKVIYKINPKLVLTPKFKNLGGINKIFEKELNINFDSFLKLDDLEAVNALFKLSATGKLSEKALINLNLVRMQSKFQRNFFENFKVLSKNFKNKSKKINPFYWAKKIMTEVTKPVDLFLKNIRTKAFKYFEKIPNIGKNLIKKYNLIPCQAESFLLAYSFEPITPDGSGYLIIYKKPYVWKKAVRISYYKNVRVWTNLIELEQFATAESQNEFYLDNFALGWGFSQASLKTLNLVGPKLARLLNQIKKFNKYLKITKMILENGIISSLKTFNYSEKISKNLNKLKNQQINKGLSNLIKIVPGTSIFTSSIIKSFRNKKWNWSWVKNDSIKSINKQIIRKVRQI